MKLNDVGDVVLDEPEAMRALADPSRLALLERVRREGQATAAELAAQERELEALETVGLVTREGNSWAAVGRGFVFDVPDDAEGAAAARKLSNAVMARSLEQTELWLADDERRLEPDWIRAAGLLGVRVTVTPDELRDLQDGFERLLAPYITRETVPAQSRPARVLTYFLPEAES